jgi:dihydrolipoamide dehydrogenase
MLSANHVGSINHFTTVGRQPSELITEGTLALEMGATFEDLLVTSHPPPTLSEAIMEAALAAGEGAIHI